MRHVWLTTLAVALLTVTAFAWSALAAEPSQDAAQGEWLPVRVQAIQVMDDNGGRVCAITKGEIRSMVKTANEVFSPARLRFSFSGTGEDFTTLRSTLINSSVPPDAQAAAPDRAPGAGTLDDFKPAAAEVAARYPGKMVVFFRYGDSLRGPTGNGFSGTDQVCVVLPALSATNMGRTGFAHEVGHYFGLGHTFTRCFKTVKEAAAFLRDNQNNVSVFDGDGLADTAPDPCIETVMANGDPELKLNGVRMLLPAGNLMSYMRPGDRAWMSQQQADVVRAYYYFRFRPNRAGDDAQEFEKLALFDNVECQPVVQWMAPWGSEKWSGGAQQFCRGKPGAHFAVEIDAPMSRRYRIVLYATSAPDYAILQARLDQEPIGEPFDGYARIVCPSGRVVLGERDLSEGKHRLSFEFVGKNADSTDYCCGLDCVVLEPVKESARRKAR